MLYHVLATHDRKTTRRHAYHCTLEREALVASRRRRSQIYYSLRRPIYKPRRRQDPTSRTNKFNPTKKLGKSFSTMAAAAAKKTVLVVAALLLVALIALEAATPASAVTDCKAGCDELRRLGVFNCEKRCEAIAAQAQKGPKDASKSYF